MTRLSWDKVERWRRTTRYDEGFNRDDRGMLRVDRLVDALPKKQSKKQQARPGDSPGTRHDKKTQLLTAANEALHVRQKQAREKAETRLVKIKNALVSPDHPAAKRKRRKKRARGGRAG